MTDDPVDLDAHRGMGGLKAADMRRQQLHDFQADQDALRDRQEQLEKLLATPAQTWPEAAVKAQYVIQLFAATPEAQDPRRKRLVAFTLEDLGRLNDSTKDAS